MKKLKLPRFEMELLSVSEMDAIKAGSGKCQTGEAICNSDTGDWDNATGDGDDD